MKVNARKSEYVEVEIDNSEIEHIVNNCSLSPGVFINKIRNDYLWSITERGKPRLMYCNDHYNHTNTLGYWEEHYHGSDSWHDVRNPTTTEQQVFDALEQLDQLRLIDKLQGNKQ